MHRTQIYFEENLFSEVKKAARQTNQSVSAYIRDVLTQDLESKRANNTKSDFSKFSGVWQDYNITQEELRSKAWK